MKYGSLTLKNFRFTVDCNILGCCWIELPPGKWFSRSRDSKFQPLTRCQIEVDVSWTEFIVHAPEGDWANVAKFRILSVDIECAGRKGIKTKNCNILNIISIVLLFRYIS